MTAPRRRPSYSLGWGTPRDHKTHSYWSVILSTILAIPCTTITTSSSRAPFYSAVPDLLQTTRVTKIGLIDLDELIEGHASKNTWKTTSIKSHLETGILSICGIRPRSYPPPDALMEIRDSSQVAQPLAEKGGLFVIPWRDRVRFHET